MSLSGYGCCAFGGAPLKPGCTLSHRFERQMALYRKLGKSGKVELPVIPLFCPKALQLTVVEHLGFIIVSICYYCFMH